MKRLSIFALLVCFAAIESFGFCGFFVAKADVDLWNEKSQVIVCRKDNKTVITMSNDYEGDLKEFAMVVPVPVVLQEKQIRVAKQEIFDKLDGYSAPRVAEYYDPNPCNKYAENEIVFNSSRVLKASAMADAVQEEAAVDLGVTIEATYTVGEYDILILSAKESNGLKVWLNKNGYKIPDKAESVLQPYIKNNMKFFVAKVNLAEQKKTGYQNLRPIQFAYSSDKFMLPIRLGMANSKGNQDLIVYTLTEKGQVETANYRTVKIPTDQDLPVFIKDDFGNFYKSVYEQAWKKEDGKAVMLEYSWDLSSSNYVKCDPCATQPPVYADLREAGVFWVKQGQNRWGGANYEGNLHITRMHVRYNRKDYPQDLLFTETPNKERFQGRYVIHHAAGKNLKCNEANAYYKGVVSRRKKEVETLASITGWDSNKYNDYVNEYDIKAPEKAKDGWINIDDFQYWGPVGDGGPNDPWTGFLASLGIFFVTMTGAVYAIRKRQASKTVQA